MRLALCLFATLATTSLMADASTLRVAWDDSSDPAVVGYRVSMGSRSGVYTVVVDAGRQTFERFDDLTAGARY
jgi:hypothetical protein